MQVIRSIRNLTLIALLSALPCASFAQISVGVAITMAPPGTAGLRAAALPATELHVDPGILGVGRPRWLLLGSGNVDDGSGGGPALDPGLLGLE
jgi:hypothetical protein